MGLGKRSKRDISLIRIGSTRNTQSDSKNRFLQVNPGFFLVRFAIDSSGVLNYKV